MTFGGFVWPTAIFSCLAACSSYVATCCHHGDHPYRLNFVLISGGRLSYPLIGVSLNITSE